MNGNFPDPLLAPEEPVRARTRIHARLVVLIGIATGVLTVVWALAYAAGTGGGAPVLPLLLGPAVGMGTALAATSLAGHPAGRAPKDVPGRRPAGPVRGTR